MANYLVTDTELTSIADAIRTKGGTSASLEFPTDFVSAIENIPSGGGGGSAKTVSITLAYGTHTSSFSSFTIYETTDGVRATNWFYCISRWKHNRHSKRISKWIRLRVKGWIYNG